MAAHILENFQGVRRHIYAANNISQLFTGSVVTFTTMKNLSIPCLLVAALTLIPGCSTVEDTQSKPIVQKATDPDRPDNGQFATDPHSVFNN